MLQIIAVFCTYLITSTAFVSALQIRIFTSTGQETDATMADFSDLLQETFSFPYQQNSQYARVQISGKDPAVVIKKIYLFRCRGMDPVDCIKNGIEPVISVNTGSSAMTFDETYKWDDVSSNSVGNFLTMVKLDAGGKEVWTGSWDKLTKTGIRTFNQIYYNADPIDLYLNSGVSADDAKTYIESYSAIPSGGMNRTIFNTVGGSSVSRLYALSGSKNSIDPSGTGVPSFYSAKLAGNLFNRSLGAFDFVFAGDGKVSNPAVFYSGSAGPVVTGGATLVIDSWSPQVVTCGSGDAIEISAHADNATVGYFQSYYYTIGGTRAGGGTMTCSIVNPTASIYSYQCSIPVSNFPACNAPGTATINVYFTYQGGTSLSAGFPATLKAPAPRLSVAPLSPSPFDCGIDRGLTATLQVSNPSGETLKKYYAFDARNFNELKNCTGSGGSYACSINESSVCQLLQENLELTFKFVYGATEVLSSPVDLLVTFPPPSVGIDTVTPQSVESGNTTNVNVLLHVNYPDFITYNDGNFNYKYLDKDFASAKCSPESSYSNIKYYKCSASLEIPSGRQGVETLSFRLDAYKEGSLKQLTANSFFEIRLPPAQPSLSIVSASSPLSCIQNPSLSVSARVDNVQGTPQTSYSVDSGKTYKPLTCSASGDVYTCAIAKDDLCGLMSSSVTLLLKFVYSGREVISNPQNVYINLPEPHLQVYSVAPDTLVVGGKTGAAVNLFVQYPQMVGSAPVFLYSYLDKTNQKMTCTKASSTSNRDFYECANTQFDIPADYSKATLPVLFMIQGTTISFPSVLAVAAAASVNPWLEIVSTTPSRIEVPQGNETSASFYVTAHNAADNELKHQATLMPNAWISAGTCTEASVQYDFNCTATIKASRTASVGPNPVTLTLRMTGKKTYDISNTTNVYVLPEEAVIDIQTVNPETLYCEGQTQQNPETVKVTANAKNLASFNLLEEEMVFNGKTIAHTDRYCTQQAQSISCNIPVDKFMEKAGCGSGELVPGGGTRYYPLTLSFLVKAGGTSMTLSGSRDVSVVARPLQPYIEFADNGIVAGLLQSRINCVDSQAIKIGQTGYVRILYADLLHPEAKDDLKWSFTLNAQDGKGKLTKGMGVSPEANATVCTLKTHQMVGAHRIEDYECSLYVGYGLFQRCAAGEGNILLAAVSSTGKKAEGSIDIRVVEDDSKYQFDFDIVTTPTRDVDCQIQSYGKGAQCSLASYSSQNVTVRVYNNNADVDMADLSIYDFDVKFGKNAGVSVNEHSVGNCMKNSKEADKYLCPFQIDPLIKLPGTDEYNVTKDSSQTDLPDIALGSLNVTLYVRYAGGLEQKALSKLDGTVTIHPKKMDSMINAEKMLEKMRKTFDSFIGIFKWVILFMSFCAVCAAGNQVVNSVEKALSNMKPGTATKGTVTPIPGISTSTPSILDCLDSDSNNDPDAICGTNDMNSYCTRLTDNSWKPKCLECAKNDGNCLCVHKNSCISSGSTAAPSAPAPQTTSASSGSDIAGIIGPLAITIGLALTVMLMFGGDADKEKNDMLDNMKKGIKWGVVTCVLPKALGAAMAGIAGKLTGKESTWTKTSKDVEAFGSAMGDVCKMILGLMPIIMQFIQFYVQYLQFETCMQMVEAQVEAGATASAGASGPLASAQQAQIEAQTAMGTTQQMMSCFNQFSGSLQQLANSMAYMGNYMGTMGGTQTYVRYSLNGQPITDNKICGQGTLHVLANLCKGGVATQMITIAGDGCGQPSGSCRGDCNYNVPMIQSGVPMMQGYSAYTNTFGSSIGGSAPISCDLPLAKCNDNIKITVTAAGSGEPKSESFTYKKVC